MDGAPDEETRVGIRTATEILSSTGKVSSINAFIVTTTTTGACLSVQAASLLTVHDSAVITANHNKRR